MPARKPAEPAGTISGQLQTPGGGAPVVGRLVTAVNNANGQRFEVRTGNTGGFTLKVPPGSYRLEVELQSSGEGLTGAPTDQRVGASDVDANIVITVGPIAGTGQHESGTEVPAPHHLVVLVFDCKVIPRPPDLRVV